MRATAFGTPEVSPAAKTPLYEDHKMAICELNPAELEAVSGGIKCKTKIKVSCDSSGKCKYDAVTTCTIRY
jgi:hypothetical protein